MTAHVWWGRAGSTGSAAGDGADLPARSPPAAAADPPAAAMRAGGAVPAVVTSAGTTGSGGIPPGADGPDRPPSVAAAPGTRTPAPGRAVPDPARWPAGTDPAEPSRTVTSATTGTVRRPARRGVRTPSATSPGGDVMGGRVLRSAPGPTAFPRRRATAPAIRTRPSFGRLHLKNSEK